MISLVMNDGGMGSSQYNKYRTVQTALILRQFFFLFVGVMQNICYYIYERRYKYVQCTGVNMRPKSNDC